MVSLTPTAVNRFNFLLKRKNFGKGAVQLSVAEKGCAGMSYTIDFHREDSTRERSPSLVKVVDDDRITLLVDRQSLGYLIGTEIDWVEGDISSQFVFKNPNATQSCSCGKSFGT